MKFSRFWKWLANGSVRPTPMSRIGLTVQKLEEREVPAIFGTGAGSATVDSIVRVYDDNGALKATIKPFPKPANQGGGYFRVCVDAAVGDVNNDGVPDLVVSAMQGGGPHVKVYDGKSINQITDGSAISSPTVLRDFFAFEPTFSGGVNISCGDVNGDGFADLICGAGPGGTPKVVVFSGQNLNNLLTFFPYEQTFAGGVDVAAGDVGGDQVTAEIITGAGPGGGPKVGVYNFVANANPNIAFQKLGEFYAFASSQTGGVNVGAGYFTNNRDVDNFLYSDIVTGTGPGTANQVKVFRLLDAVNGSGGQPDWKFFAAATYAPYATAFSGGVRVGGVLHGGLGLSDILTGPQGNGGPDLKIWNQAQIGDLVTYTPTLRLNFFPYDPTYSGGITVGGQ